MDDKICGDEDKTIPSCVDEKGNDVSEEFFKGLGKYEEATQKLELPDELHKDLSIVTALG